jgi:hypothetical protein
MRVVEAIFVQRGYNLATMPSKNKDIFHNKEKTMVRLSAWEDYAYTASTNDFRFYINDDDGNTIYSGRAIAKPNEAFATVNVMPIVRDCLNDYCPRDWDFTTFTNIDAVIGFHIYDEKDTEVESLNVIYCYDYETQYNNIWDVLHYGMTGKINNHTAAGMYTFSTTIEGSAFTTEVDEVTGGTHCGQAAIYFISSKGGWSSFLIEGNVQKTRNYERYTYDRYADANSMQFGKMVMANAITDSWELKTHYMTDDESRRLSSLLVGTPQAFLHTFDDGRIVPIVMDDKSVKCLTYRNNGHKMFTYTIKCTESQTKMHR